MKKIFLLITVGALCLSLASCGKKNETDNKEIAEDQNKAVLEDTDIKKDAEFAVDAADAGMFEVMLGKVAAESGQSADVKQLGQMMVDEHSKANEELKTLAAQKNITLPVGLSEKKQKKYDEISTKSGLEFDKAYADAMESGHKDVLDAFKKEADKGNDPDIKSWAAGKVSTLEHHLAESERVHKVVKDLKK